MPFIPTIDTTGIGNAIGAAITVQDRIAQRAEEAKISKAKLDYMKADNATLRTIKSEFAGEPEKWADEYTKRMGDFAESYAGGFQFQETQDNFINSVGAATEQSLGKIYEEADKKIKYNTRSNALISLASTTNIDDLELTMGSLWNDPVFGSAFENGQAEARQSLITASSEQAVNIFQRMEPNTDSKELIRTINEKLSVNEGDSQELKLFKTNVSNGITGVKNVALGKVSKDTRTGLEASYSTLIYRNLRNGNFEGAVKSLEGLKTLIQSDETSEIDMNNAGTGYHMTPADKESLRSSIERYESVILSAKNSSDSNAEKAQNDLDKLVESNKKAVISDIKRKLRDASPDEAIAIRTAFDKQVQSKEYMAANGFNLEQINEILDASSEALAGNQTSNNTSYKAVVSDTISSAKSKINASLPLGSDAKKNAQIEIDRARLLTSVETALKSNASNIDMKKWDAVGAKKSMDNIVDVVIGINGGQVNPSYSALSLFGKPTVGTVNTTTGVVEGSNGNVYKAFGNLLSSGAMSSLEYARYDKGSSEDNALNNAYSTVDLVVQEYAESRGIAYTVISGGQYSKRDANGEWSYVVKIVPKDQQKFGKQVTEIVMKNAEDGLAFRVTSIPRGESKPQESLFTQKMWNESIAPSGAKMYTLGTGGVQIKK